jgi:glycosyltransferase involved in cell wall biosynthesis
MKRVLIITYYWPPSGGGGVMRWLKMSKYLPELGWQPVIFTPENPDPSVYDESLIGEVHPATEIIRLPIWEPYGIYRRITGKNNAARFKAGYISEASRGNLKERLSVFLRGNFLIPDPRIFWVRPALRFLSRYLKANPVDLIITTGPPHSMHLIGLGLKKKIKTTPWLADFRDPWTEIDFYHRLKLTWLADKIHRSLEKKVLKQADIITTVSPLFKSGLERISGRKIDLVYNGYDPEDFNFNISTDAQHFTISHYGAFNRDRNPSALWIAMGNLAKENPDFARMLRIQLIGQNDESILMDLNHNGLIDNLQQIGHLPHREGLQLLSKSQLLLLPLNEAPTVMGILPGKMYEYIALRRPILAIGPPEADFARILNETKAGYINDFRDIKGIQTTLQTLFDTFLEGKLAVQASGHERFSRKQLAREIISLPFA